ncbi:hypothetical protein [Arthrobacter sp. A2-55]|uniref:hypothetical protein n=1 Tax=Arthrobacter sp. A2-55 TaxID=2897337 RepID=UPI0021CD610A|nr:hypothetical protein [Arthrobacter sp. A2-55]MCU6479045.1 hypothetical protein [Arthrobacter sp. A2-55]
MATQVFIDVDGCISPHPPHSGLSRTNAGWTGEWTDARVGPYDCLWSHDLVRELNVLSVLPNVQFNFLTSWEDHAREFLPSIGLDCSDWPFLTGVDGDSPGDWWKLRALQRAQPMVPLDRLVWIDDELNRQPEALGWLKTLGVPVLAISPCPVTGLTPAHLETIKTFVSGPAAALPHTNKYEQRYSFQGPQER